MVANTYAEVIRSIPPKFRGRKVLAGCVMVRGNDLGSSETIAIAAGVFGDFVSVDSYHLVTYT